MILINKGKKLKPYIPQKEIHEKLVKIYAEERKKWQKKLSFIEMIKCWTLAEMYFPLEIF
jgi:nitrogen fixation protein